MKKETINTFEKGMVKDLHPLTTPNNILTDALNATLITYNGNENILQNDMGNTQVGTAFLPAGYVPVGMKEHGGIVYVAAYNPETGKGLIGSFPSPQLLWASENWSVNALANTVTSFNNFNTEMYDGNFIKKESCKKELFNTNNGPTIFHPGDKFIILYDKSAIAYAINNGYASILLGVVKLDGSIEIMRTWSKESNDSSFLYDDSLTSELLKTKLTDRSIVQVFDASSSGYLVLIFNLHTLDTFNLTRTYSERLVGNLKKIRVEFKGEGYKDGILYNSSNIGTDGYYLGLVKTNLLNEIDSNNSEKAQIIVDENGNTASFNIYPCVEFGIIERMKRNITINFDKIRKSLDDFSEWRFYVTEKYVKIGWAYDFYNLDHTKEIEYIRMYFYKLEDGYKASREGVPYVTFLKENYNGNFEDYINYTDIGIQYKNIYIVEIVKKFKNASNEDIICFEMLYLSKLYNSNYNKFYTNNAIGDSLGNSSTTGYSAADNQTVKVKLKFNLDSNITLSKAKLLKPGDLALGSEIDISEVNSNSFATSTSLLDTSNLSNYQYITQIKNTYTNNLLVTAEVDYDSDLYIGSPNLDVINDAIGKPLQITINDEGAWIPNAIALYADISDITYTSISVARVDSLDINDGICTHLPFDTEIYRYILGKVSEVKTTSYESIGLQPLYSPSYTADKKNRIAPYWSQDSARCIAGAGEDENGIYYNSSLRRDGGIIEGPNSGGGFDDGGLATASNYMGNPMTNIFSGIYGEEAELAFLGLGENSSVANSNEMDFISSHGEIGGKFLDYQGDNFLIACWKFTDGSTHFVNLETPRKPTPGLNISQENFLKSTVKWPRLDVMLRCILSQIFVASRITSTVEFITASDKFYRYLDGNTNIVITEGTEVYHESPSALRGLLIDGKTPKEWLLEKWGYRDGKIRSQNGNYEDTGLGDDYDLTNLIPDISISIDSINETIQLPAYNIDTVMASYLNAGFKDTSSSDITYSPLVIYGIDINKTAENLAACANPERNNNGDPIKIKANIDGTYEWKSTPACVALTSLGSGSNLTIYRWNDSNLRILFLGFGSKFKTRGKMEEWITVPEGEENEVYAIDDGNSRTGKWTNADNENAPDMYPQILYSSNISALSNS